MITPSDLQICATTNQLTVQLTCQHVIDTDDGRCGQATVIKGLRTQHAPFSEEDLSKLFQISKVNMVTVDDTRKVVASSELLAGEI